jgi:hypothetical protein
MSESDRPFTALPKPELDEAQAKEPRARRGFAEGAFGIFVLVILASLSGGLIAIYWPWMRGTETSDANDRLTALETRIGQMSAGQASKAAAESFEAERRDLAALKNRVDADEARLSELESSPGQSGGASPAGTDLAAIQKTLTQLAKDSDDRAKASADLSGRVTALEKSAPPTDLATRLDSFALKSDEAALDARLKKLESEDPSGTLRRAASVLALADLVRASEGDGAFIGELAALRTLSPSPELSNLAHYSKGVPTRAVLTEQFSAGADSILAAERRSHASDWLNRLWASLVNLVSVRRVGNVSGNDSESRIARAEFDLRAGDLDSAVSEVSKLVGPARDAAAPWLAEAKARQAIARDTQAATNRIVAGLAAPQ